MTNQGSEKASPGSLADPSTQVRTATAAHTPGPWRASGLLSGAAQIFGIMSDAGKGLVATARDPLHRDDVAKANARLIATAPDLLIALEEAAQRLDARGHKFGAEEARAAITKATGAA